MVLFRVALGLPCQWSQCHALFRPNMYIYPKWLLHEGTSDNDWAEQMRILHVSFINESMKPQWIVSCGKAAASDQFTVILRTSTLDVLPTRPLHPFLVRPATANRRGDIISLSFCGHENCLY